MSYCSECGELYKHREDCPTQTKYKGEMQKLITSVSEPDLPTMRHELAAAKVPLIRGLPEIWERLDYLEHRVSEYSRRTLDIQAYTAAFTVACLEWLRSQGNYDLGFYPHAIHFVRYSDRAAQTGMITAEHNDLHTAVVSAAWRVWKDING